jgi:hypothetical protein
MLTDLAMSIDLENIHTVMSPASSERGISTRAALQTLVIIDFLFSMGAYLLAVCAVLFMRCFQIFSDRSAKFGVWLPCCAFLAMCGESIAIWGFLRAAEPTKADQIMHLLLTAAVRVKWLTLFLNAGVLCYATVVYFGPKETITFRTLPVILGSMNAMIPTLYAFSSVLGVVSILVPSFVFLLPLAINIVKGGWAATSLYAAAFYLGLLEEKKEDGEDNEGGEGGPTFGPEKEKAE